MTSSTPNARQQKPQQGAGCWERSRRVVFPRTLFTKEGRYTCACFSVVGVVVCVCVHEGREECSFGSTRSVPSRQGRIAGLQYCNAAGTQGAQGRRVAGTQWRSVGVCCHWRSKRRWYQLKLLHFVRDHPLLQRKEFPLLHPHPQTHSPPARALRIYVRQHQLAVVGFNLGGLQGGRCSRGSAVVM